MRGSWLAAIVVGLVGFGVFIGTVGHEFTFDDTWIIRDSPLVTGHGAETGLRRILTGHYWGGSDAAGSLYRPITILTYRLNHILGGDRPAGYHLVNVLLHAAVCATLVPLFRRLSGSPIAATAGALLYAVHPVHTEAVAGVVGRAELLAALFVLLAWLQRRRLFVSLAWFACALLSKENAIVLPLLLLIEDTGAGRSGSGSRAGSPAERFRVLVPYLAVVVSYLLLRTALGITIGDPTGPFAGTPATERLMTAVDVLGRYILLMVFPVVLSADYSFDQIPVVRSLADPGFLIGIVLTTGLAAGGWLLRRLHVTVWTGVLVFFASILPVANLLFGIGVVMAERLLYLPSAGGCLAAGGLLAAMASPATASRGRRWRPAMAAAMTLVLAGSLGMRAISQAAVWEDPLTLFEATTRSSPRSALAWLGLGSANQAEGRVEEAEAAYRRSISIDPERAGTHHNLATLLQESGRIDEAIHEYRIAVRLDPLHVGAWSNLGTLLEARGESWQAEAAYRRAIEANPEDIRPMLNLASMLEARSDPEAMTWYRSVLRREPLNLRALNNLGRLLIAAGQPREAIAILRTALEADESALPPRVNLAAAYLAAGDAARAESTVLPVLEADPTDETARRVLDAARAALR